MEPVSSAEKHETWCHAQAKSVCFFMLQEFVEPINIKSCASARKASATREIALRLFFNCRVGNIKTGNCFPHLCSLERNYFIAKTSVVSYHALIFKNFMEHLFSSQFSSERERS